MTPAFKPDDYVDVAERIRGFKQMYPEGSLQSLRDPMLIPIGDRIFIAYAAAAYRTPDDPRPGIGWAWEPVPGPTPFTKDSELMNAETSAWGRAIVALGFETKKIASAEEVRNRSEGGGSVTQDGGASPSPSDKPTPEQRQRMSQLLLELNQADSSVVWEDVAKRFMFKEFSAAHSDQLTQADFERLLLHLGIKLDALTSVDVPIG